MKNPKEQQGFPPRRLHIRREDLNDLVAAGNGAAADIYVECSDSIFITHHEVYVPEALLAEAVREAKVAAIEEITGWLGLQAHLSYESYERLRVNLEHKAKAASTDGGKGGGNG